MDDRAKMDENHWLASRGKYALPPGRAERWGLEEKADRSGWWLVMPALAFVALVGHFTMGWF